MKKNTLRGMIAALLTLVLVVAAICSVTISVSADEGVGYLMSNDSISNAGPTHAPSNDSSGGTAPALKAYDILVEETTGGAVKLTRDWAYAGTKVSFSLTPAEGYRVYTVTAKTVKGRDVDLTLKEDGTYSFKMPAVNVVLYPKFDRIFSDVPEGRYFTEPVRWASAEGITAGVGGGRFAPDSPVTRAELVTFMWRYAGCPEPTLTEVPFVDVPQGASYEKALLWAVETGFTVGVGEDRFAPDKPLNRAMAMAFLRRYFNNESDLAGLAFADVPATAWFHDDVAWGVGMGIVAGLDETHFGPANLCLRGQYISLLYRVVMGAAA